MTYRLVVITDGRGLLRGTLASFAAKVTPSPVAVDVRCDGADAYREAVVARLAVDLDAPWHIYGNLATDVRDGFCAATAEAWDWAAASDVDYVFWLEDDFRFLRPVDLTQLARVLATHHDVAQVALCRGPANDYELAAGGLVESRPGQYEPRWGVPVPGREFDPEWLLHRAYFTTTPSLMTRAFMAHHPFPAALPECEGRFGLDLAAHGWSFGLWGAGEPWVDHVGVRAGEGY